jgi:hypothetical protein
LHEARFEHDEQLSPLAQFQIPIASQLTNFGTDSNLNLVSILKGFKPCGKNLANSLKISLDLMFTTVNLVGPTGMKEIRVPIQVSK